ncbi:MAG: transporter substrate-binding domain-containing protein [Clostridia bacterium]
MKKDKIKLIIISFIVIALSILLLENKKSEVFAQASEENRNGLTVEKVIRVGWWEQPKFQEKDSNGNYTGYCYEYLCKIAEINNWKYKFVEDKFENLYKSLKEGKIDILGCLFYTSEREKELDMSTFDMGEMYSTMFTLKTSKLQSEDFNAFNNIKIAVINSNNLVALNKYAEDNGFKADILICSDYKEILKTLDDGRADAGVVGGMADSKYKILAKFAPNKFYFATSKDNSEISVPLNKALSKISIDDPYYKTRLADKYLYGMEVSLLLNKTQTIILLTTIIVIFSLLIIIAYVKIKYNISEKKRINEMYYLMKYIFKINDSVGEINLLKNEIIKYTLNNKSINKEKVEFLPYEIEKSIYLEDIELYKKSVSQEALNEIINNQSQRAFELRKKNKDKYEWHAFVLQGIAKDDEHPCNFMYFDRNIDTIKRADEIQNNALIYASKEIAKASEAKSAFVSKISHEIRTPLNAIFGYLNIAKNDITNLSKMTDNLFKSEIAAKQLLDVINDVTDITSIDNRKLKILKQPFELRQLINTLYIMFEQQAKLKDITFVVTVDERLEKFVLGDCLRVNQILLNLLSNAIKFTNNGGLVSFKTEVFWITKDTTAV